MTANDEVLRAIEDGDAVALNRVLARHPEAASARDANAISAVLNAQYRSRSDLVEALLATDPELDIFEASAVGDTGRVGELLDGDPLVSTAWSPDGFTALHLAAFFGYAHIAELLIDAGADVGAVARNAMRVMPLHSAAAGRHVEAAELLLRRGADVDARSQEGFTPLQEAAQNGDEDMVDLLLANGADPTRTMEDGRIAADLAAEGAHHDLATRLRQAD